MKYILYFIPIILSLSCSGKNHSDYQDGYNSRIILMSLIAAKPNPQGACETAAKSAGSCIFKAKDRSALADVYGEEIYASAVLSSNRQLNYADYCKDQLNSSAYEKMSDAYRQCSFNCMKQSWDAAVNAKSCEKFNTADLVTTALNGTKICLIKCAKPTNN